MKSTIIRNVMTVLLALFSLHVSAQTVYYNGLKYNLNGNTAEVIGKDPNSFVINTNVTIPSSMEYGGKQYSVTSIGKEAFKGCSSLASVNIGDNVISIGDSAFEGCSGLTSVHVTDLAAWCKISFSDNPLKYAHHLYQNSTEIKDLVIPNSVTSIASGAFSGCSGLTSVTIPSSVTSIGSNAFSGCSDLTSVNIPYGVKSIAFGAFYGCSSLTSVNIPYSVTSIGSDAFHYCI